ncbi:MAG: hypothetical protein MI861_06445, partial [Pirellulales bacterium]|nr:hypothetical protein [Pirellulales bacterium]
LRQRRAAARRWSEQDLALREQSQMDIQEKRRLSNFVIINDGSLQQLNDTIDRLWSSLLKRQTEHPSLHHCLQNQWGCPEH